MKKLIVSMILLLSVTTLLARAGGAGGGHASSSSGGHSFSSGGSKSSSFSSRGMSYTSMRSSVRSGPTSSSCTITNISSHTGYASSWHPLNNAVVWMLILKNPNNANLSDEEFEEHAHKMLLTQVCTDFYNQYNQCVEHTRISEEYVVVSSHNREYYATYDNSTRKTTFYLNCADIEKRNHNELLTFLQGLAIVVAVITLVLLSPFILSMLKTRKDKKREVI